MGKTHSFIAHDKSHPLTAQIYTELNALRKEMERAGYVPDTRFVGRAVSQQEKEDILSHHSEKLALAFALISLDKDSPILLRQNLRICRDCHTATALISKLRRRKIIVRDAKRYHHVRTANVPVMHFGDILYFFFLFFLQVCVTQ